LEPFQIRHFERGEGPRDEVENTGFQDTPINNKTTQIFQGSLAIALSLHVTWKQRKLRGFSQTQ